MISKRLQEIASLIEKNKVVFDVGSDHALLPCFLIENNITNKVYASEVNEGPYQKVIETINKHHLQDKIIPFFTDGLNNCPDDVDIVVIAGMGYYTIEHILNDTVVNKYDYIIVQSNSDVDLLRKYISDHNYTIEDEKVVKDGFYYQIVKFSGKYHDKYSYLDIKYGPVNLKNKDKIFVDYLNDLKDRLIKINVNANKDDYKQTIREIEEFLV